jgi:3-oxoacyl-[acyl-carrier-protein] synthase-3
LTNADLEKMVATSDQWIMERTGIRERHIVDPGVATSDLAAEAARRCLEKRGIAATDVEVIIVATVTPDMFFPATACLVQNKIGAKGAWGFDLSAACSGFPYALQMGAKLIESGVQKKVMVIGADVMSSIIDYKDRATCVIFGDGAGAVLLEPCAEGEIGMIDYLHEIDGSGAVSLNMPGGGSLHPPTAETVAKNMHVVHQDGQAVYKFAVRKMAEASETVLARNGVTGKDLSLFIPHQANKRIILSTAERLIAAGASGDQHRPLRQHHGGDDSHGNADGVGGEPAEEGRPGAAGERGRGLYGGSYAAAVGDVGTVVSCWLLVASKGKGKSGGSGFGGCVCVRPVGGD